MAGFSLFGADGKRSLQRAYSTLSLMKTPFTPIRFCFGDEVLRAAVCQSVGVDSERICAHALEGKFALGAKPRALANFETLGR